MAARKRSFITNQTIDTPGDTSHRQPDASALRWLARSVTALQLLHEPDPSAALVDVDDEIMTRRRGFSRRRWIDDDALSPLCLRIQLNPSSLDTKHLDIADTQEEIERAYPDRFEILRNSAPSAHSRNAQSGCVLRLRPRITASTTSLPLIRTFTKHLLIAVSDIGDNDRRRRSRPRSTGTPNIAVQALQDFAQRLGNGPDKGPHTVVDSTDNSAWEKYVYNPDTKYLEVGKECRGCHRHFLAKQISVLGITQGYCLGCADREFCSCVLCHQVFNLNYVVTAACACRYCPTCFAQNFAAGLRSPEDFPPSCCGREISVIEYRKHIPDTALKDYVDIIDNFKDKIQLHCADEKCQAYIKPNLISDGYGLCARCFSVTCQGCRSLKSSHIKVHGMEQCTNQQAPVTNASRASLNQAVPHSRTSLPLYTSPPTNTITASSGPRQLHRSSSVPAYPATSKPADPRVFKRASRSRSPPRKPLPISPADQNYPKTQYPPVAMRVQIHNSPPQHRTASPSDQDPPHVAQSAQPAQTQQTPIRSNRPTQSSNGQSSSQPHSSSHDPHNRNRSRSKPARKPVNNTDPPTSFPPQPRPESPPHSVLMSASTTALPSGRRAPSASSTDTKKSSSRRWFRVSF